MRHSNAPGAAPRVTISRFAFEVCMRFLHGQHCGAVAEVIHTRVRPVVNLSDPAFLLAGDHSSSNNTGSSSSTSSRSNSSTTITTTASTGKKRKQGDGTGGGGGGGGGGYGGGEAGGALAKLARLELIRRRQLDTYARRDAQAKVDLVREAGGNERAVWSEEDKAAAAAAGVLVRFPRRVFGCLSAWLAACACGQACVRACACERACARGCVGVWVAGLLGGATLGR